MTKLFETIEYYLQQRWFILTLIVINFLGSIYGFYWYKNQLLQTSTEWLIFVPDSPTSSMFFTIFLILYYFNKKSPFIEAMGSITAFKYGIWAVVMILWGAWAEESSITKILMIETITWTDVMLMLSHLGMAVQAILFFRKYHYGFFAILFVGTWTLLNDFYDYTKDIHPWLPYTISDIDFTVGQFTIFLSGFTLLLFYFLSLLRRKLA